MDTKQDKKALKEVNAFMQKAKKKIEEVEVTVKYEMPEENSLEDVNKHKWKGSYDA